MLSRGLRPVTWLGSVIRLARRPKPEPTLNKVVQSTRPDPSEAEMDRYTRYHKSNQHGR